MKKLFLALFLTLAAAYPQHVNAVLPDATSRQDFTGDGKTTVFAYTFKITNKAYIKVLVNGVTQTVDTNFTVSGVNADGGGSVTFISGAPASGATVVLLRNQPVDQTTTYQPGGGFPARRVEQDLDANAAIDQMQQEQINRSLKLPETIAPTSTTTTIPAPVAGKCIGWNSSGNQLANNDCSGGGGTGGSVHSIDGVNLTSNDPVNFQDTATIDVSNPSAGNVQFAVKSGSIGATQITNQSITTSKLAVVRGNTTTVQLASGSYSTDECAKFDVDGNLVGAGAACGAGGGGSFTGVSGTANEITSSNSSGPTTTLSLPSTLDLQSKTLLGATPLCFEGVTSNAYKTCFAVADPTGNRTITFPEVTGRVMLDQGLSNGFIVRLAQDTFANQILRGTTNQINVADGNGATGVPTFSIASNPQLTGTVNASTGYQVAGAATSGQYLRGDGTKFVGSAIQAGDIPTSGAYTWTGTHTFNEILQLGAQSPAQITGDQNNYALSARAIHRLSTDASRTITGFASGGTFRLEYLMNVGSYDIVLAHESSSSTVANRITSVTGADLTIPAGAMAVMVYDTTSSRWRAFAMRSATVTEADTLDTVFDRGKVINGATSFANAFRVTDASGDGVAIYRSAGTGPVITCIIATVENDCDHIETLAVGKSKQIKNNGGTSLFTVDEANGVTVATGLTGGFTIPYTGTGASGAIQDADDFPKIVRVPYGQTITKICGSTDTGTTTFNLQRNDGSPADIAASNIVAATSEACTTSFTSGENILTEGQYIDLVIVTGATSGTPTKLTIGVNTVRN